ncbi:hypothetical protein GOV04_00255 [Candidatus Woesearchaeota archaeon]|nr:hypothetical protein [Candidatus Woesearchaeota archaeon]
MNLKKHKNALYAAIVAITIAGIILTVISFSPDRTAFAECLTSQGVEMYGTYWCHNCQDQKNMFGKNAFSNIVYIECTTAEEYCEEKEITAYPTWIINDQQLVGLQELETLSELTGCQLE